jgi:hypothetical protein
MSRAAAGLGTGWMDGWTGRLFIEFGLLSFLLSTLVGGVHQLWVGGLGCRPFWTFTGNGKMQWKGWKGICGGCRAP